MPSSDTTRVKDPEVGLEPSDLTSDASNETWYRRSNWDFDAELHSRFDREF